MGFKPFDYILRVFIDIGTVFFGAVISTFLFTGCYLPELYMLDSYAFAVLIMIRPQIVHGTLIAA